MATKPSDDEQIWRDNLETGLTALNSGDLNLAEVAFLDSLKYATVQGAPQPGQIEHMEQTLKLLSELAARIYFERDEARAIQLCEQVVQIGNPVLGGKSSAVYTAACLLADHYFDQEQESDITPRQAVLEELMQILTQAADVVLDEDAEMVGNGLYMLASLYYSSEQYASAEKLIRQTLNLRKLAPPQLRAALLQDYEVFVNTLCWQAKFEEAETAGLHWMALAEEELPQREIYRAQILLTLGEVYRMLQRDDEAESAYERAIAIHEAEECGECEEMAAILRAYARFLNGTRRPDEAQVMIRRAAKINDDEEDVFS